MAQTNNEARHANRGQATKGPKGPKKSEESTSRRVGWAYGRQPDGSKY